MVLLYCNKVLFMRFRLIKLCDCTLEYIHYVLCVYQHDLGMVQKHQRLDSLSRVATIGTQQAHHTKELHHMDQSKDAMIIVLKLKKRDCHLGTRYGPVGLW